MSTITKDMTPVEVANLLGQLEHGHEAAWLSTRELSWQSPEYESRFQNAVDIDGVFRDILQETIDSGMRRPGEPVEEFAERAESEAWLADAREADADWITRQADADVTPEPGGESQNEIATRLSDDASTPEGRAYKRAFSDAAPACMKGLRERNPLPEPDRAPGAPHPDPFLASRGWCANENGIFSRKPEPQAAPGPEKDLEAGLWRTR